MHVNVATCFCHWQEKCLEEMKESDDNISKTWVEESPHPYENNANVSKVTNTFY